MANWSRSDQRRRTAVSCSMCKRQFRCTDNFLDHIKWYHKTCAEEMRGHGSFERQARRQCDGSWPWQGEDRCSKYARRHRGWVQPWPVLAGNKYILTTVWNNISKVIVNLDIWNMSFCVGRICWRAPSPRTNFPTLRALFWWNPKPWSGNQCERVQATQSEWVEQSSILLESKQLFCIVIVIIFCQTMCLARKYKCRDSGRSCNSQCQKNLTCDNHNATTA